MKKKLQLVALPTDKDKESSLYLQQRPKIRFLYNIRQTVAHTNNTTPYHLYLLSDEEIKDNEWHYNKNLNKVVRESHYGDLVSPKYGCYKTVSTTNSDLWYEVVAKVKGGDIHDHNLPLIPKIPLSLIQDFVKKQGKVDSVMVEYDYAHTLKEDWERPRVTSSGEIIWSPVEERMYTWDDIEQAYIAGVMNNGRSFVNNFPLEVDNHKTQLDLLKKWFDEKVK
jgi:hypothetical protein